MLHAGLGLAVFVLAAPLAAACGRLPTEVYEGASIAARAIGHVPVVVLALSTVVALGLGRRLAWSEFTLGREVRWLAFAAALALSWELSTYEFNYWLQRAHDLDRLAMAVLPWLVLWRPAWLGLFVAYAHVMAGQFGEPLPGASPVDRVLFEVLLLLFVFVLLHAVRPTIGFLPFLYATLCLVALHYAAPGAGKLWLAWLPRNDGGNAVLAAWHQIGWLSWLGEEGHGQLQVVLSSVGVVAKVLVLVLELSLLAILAHRRVAIGALVGCVLLHVGVFALTGTLAWTWMLLAIGLVVIVVRLRPQAADLLFGRNAVLTQLAMVVALFVLHRPEGTHAAYDAPLAYHFRIELIGESGELYQVPPAELAPYDAAFAEARLYYLSRLPMLVGSLGSTDQWSLVDQLAGARTEEDLFDSRVQLGRNAFDETRARDFDRLLQRYVEHRRAGTRSNFQRLPQPPRAIWASAAAGGSLPVYAGQERVMRGRVRLRESLIRHGRLHPIHEAVVRRIAWPDGGSIYAGETP